MWIYRWLNIALLFFSSTGNRRTRLEADSEKTVSYIFSLKTAVSTDIYPSSSIYFLINVH